MQPLQPLALEAELLSTWSKSIRSRLKLKGIKAFSPKYKCLPGGEGRGGEGSSAPLLANPAQFDQYKSENRQGSILSPSSSLFSLRSPLRASPIPSPKTLLLFSLPRAQPPLRAHMREGAAKQLESKLLAAPRHRTCREPETAPEQGGKGVGWARSRGTARSFRVEGGRGERLLHGTEHTQSVGCAPTQDLPKHQHF